ncbi:hypothetical protein STCU_08408 [Strigomonas culicis]|nr:hypothetical protein STCU_08408 [Strigomonas culicis]|eukprot:EPY21982.1 hypothetical protein STCU_08408 [Strigomonas culicis]
MLQERAPAGAREVPILCGTGPILPKEWAVHSTAALGEDGGPRFPHPHSATALTFAVANEALRTDAGLLRAARLQVGRLFARESVTLLEEPDGADVLALVNACLPLCSFGAGLVSNAYAGNSVGALAAYLQHACSATEALVNTLLGRPRGSPLPPAVWSSLSMACTTFASREFVLGRQLDYHFKKNDALRAVYSGMSHANLAATVDGIHTLLQRHQYSSPFYEVLMDAFNTHIRASVAGEGLVKEGYYGYRESPPSPLLREITKVDDALFSGDEERFEKARKNFEKVFSDSLKK